MIRNIVRIAGVCMVGALALEGRAECLILDRPVDHIYEVGLAVVPESRFEGNGKSAVLEVDTDWTLAYFRDVAAADISIGLEIASTIFMESTALSLPDQVARTVIDLGSTWRFDKAPAVQLRLEPGLYSDFEDLDFDGAYMPVSLALIQAFSADFSGIAGLQYRMDFDRELIPLIGVAWEITDGLRLDAQIPESRLTWYITEGVRTFVGAEWRNMSYRLSHSGAIESDQLTLEDIRLRWAALFKVTDQVQLTAEMGGLVNRSVEFGDEDTSRGTDVEIDDSLYGRLALGCPF